MRTVRIMLLNVLSTVLIMITPEEEIIFLRITETMQELSHISSIGTLIYCISNNKIRHVLPPARDIGPT